jgi:hypothetical protein
MRYLWKRELYTNAIAAFIYSFIPNKHHLNTPFHPVVNA